MTPKAPFLHAVVVFFGELKYADWPSKDRKMGNRVLKSGIFLALFLTMSACSGSWDEDGIGAANANAKAQEQAINETPSAEKTPDQILLFPGSAAEKPYTVIQNIKVAVNKTTVISADPTVSQVQEQLKESAAALGGDAVVNVVISEVKVRALSWGGRTGIGTVVRY
ncbi:hypothetical protein [Roseobacter litoralis]|uniref:hypothetical protein n=1 Tax=Roseobacter litoralis TaxID=42443 RepID=UPI0024946A0D|nr:hypothetical protein [Roseobacter litoralis]